MVRFFVACGFVVLFGWGNSATAKRIVLTGDVASKALLEVLPIAGDDVIAPIDLNFSLPSIDVEKNADGFDEVAIQGLSYLEKAGAPKLFTTGVLIAVPKGYKPQLSISQHWQKVLPDYWVAPTQKKYRCDCPENDNFQFRAPLYRSQAVFPESVIRLEKVGSIRDIEIMRVGLYPLQMEFSKRQLRVTTDLKATVQFVRTQDTTEVQRLPKPLFELVRQVTSNAQTFPKSVLAPAATNRMLIVVADALEQSLDSFIEWERAKGTIVDVLSYGEVGSDTKKLRKAIQAYAKENDVSYLLFVGNDESLPPIKASTASGPAPTDYNYALFDTWDDLPDVLYGRLLADTPEEVLTQTKRWIAYEKQPTAEASWYHQGLTIASREGAGPSDKEYAESVADALKSFTYSEIDPLLEGSKTATTPNIANAINAGRSWIAYFGHGDGTSWPSTNDDFNNDDISALTNTEGKLPVIIDVACLNTAYTKYPDNFGKRWVTHQVDEDPAGAVAFYGGSVIISWDPPAIMSQGIAKYHFEKPVHTLGGSVFAGQLYLIEKKGSDDEIIDNIRWYNLFGNPAMILRTDTPKSYHVEQTFVTAQQGKVLKVTATAPSGAPMANLDVSIQKRGEQPFAVAKTSELGVAEIVVQEESLLSGESVVTITGYNAETQQILIR